MKVRIANNKIRYRLKKPEVAHFALSGIVTETLAFGNDDAKNLRFSLQRSDDATISVRFQHNHTVIYVPAPLAEEWTTTERVGFEAEVITEENRKIAILVEKDFMCMDGREEENEGSYPNPLLTAAGQ